MPLRAFYAFIIALCVIAAIPLAAQTRAEVLAKNHAAHGGLARLKQVKNFLWTGKMSNTAANVEMPLLVWWKYPEKLRIETELQGKKAVYASDGVKTWWVMPNFASDEAQQMPSTEARRVVELARLWSWLFVNYEQNEGNLELVGAEKIDGVLAHKLKATRRDNSIAYFYINADTGLLLRCAYYFRAGENEILSELVFSDYKNTSGIMLPQRIDELVSGKIETRITISICALNTVMSDSVFTIPVKNAASPAAASQK